MSNRTLLLGLDLGDEKTQLAVYNRESREPELMGATEENPEALYDTVIQMEGMEPLTGFLPRIRQGEEIVVEGKKSDPVNVLAYYFRRTLAQTRKHYPSETIRQLVVTVEKTSLSFVQLIYDALERLGIGRDRALVLGHKQSYLYFVLYQKAELWVNDVGLFDYDGVHLSYYQMQLDRRKKPVPVRVMERDFTGAMSVADVDASGRGAVFENIVYSALHKQILSTLYMTGSGFEDEWTDAVFQKLCVGRRLFRGQNLYVSGACYAAKEMGGRPRLTDYLLMDEDMLTSHLSIQVYKDAKVQDHILAKAGIPWYQIDNTIELIPDGENELSLTVTDIFSQKQRHFILDLEPVAGKTGRQCRLALRVRFSDIHTCIVTMKDKGFGELFPTSNRIWERTITIS